MFHWSSWCPWAILSSALFARLTAAVNSLLLLMILLFEIICVFAVLCWSAKWLFWGEKDESWEGFLWVLIVDIRCLEKCFFLRLHTKETDASSSREKKNNLHNKQILKPKREYCHSPYKGCMCVLPVFTHMDSHSHKFILCCCVIYYSSFVVRRGHVRHATLRGVNLWSPLWSITKSPHSKTNTLIMCHSDVMLLSRRLRHKNVRLVSTVFLSTWSLKVFHKVVSLALMNVYYVKSILSISQLSV